MNPLSFKDFFLLVQNPTSSDSLSCVRFGIKKRNEQVKRIWLEDSRHGSTHENHNDADNVKRSLKPNQCKMKSA